MKKSFLILSTASILIGAGILFAGQASALCSVDEFCHNSPPKLISITPSPDVVTTESSVNISVLAIAGLAIYDNIYEGGPETITFDPSVTISGNIKDENGVVKATLNSVTVSCDGGGSCSYNGYNVNVSGWSDGIYTVHIDLVGGNGGNALFEIRRGNSDDNAGPPDVHIESDKSWVYVGDTVNITWSSNDAQTCSATEGPGFDTGGARNGTDESDTLNTVGTETFSVECTKVTVNPGTGEEITNTASASVGVDVVSRPPAPTVTLSMTPSMLRESGDLTLSWNTSGADVCELTISGNKYDEINGVWNVDPNSSGMSIPAAAAMYSGDMGNVNAALSCSNAGGTTVRSDSSTIFHNYVHWYAYVKNSCSDPDDSASRMVSSDEQSIRFDAQIREVDGTVVRDYTDSRPDDGDDRSWGPMPKVYDVKPGTIPYDSSNPVKYNYCDYSGPVTVNQTTGLPPQEKTAKLFFVAGGGGGLPAPTLNAVGECRQNSPNTQTQVYLSWNAVSGASSYNVYRDGSSIANVSGTSYIDIFNPPQYNASHSYYVKAVDSSGNEGAQSNTVNATTPNSCDSPPPAINDSLNVIPSSATINAQGCSDPTSQQFTALYDPDGPGGNRYGNFDVTSLANWSSSNNFVAVPDTITKGKFNGINSGSATVMAAYRFLSATAGLNVSSCSSPDFSISISPVLRTVDVSGGDTSTTYTVTLTALNSFSGNVDFSISNLLSPMSGSFSPGTVSLNGDQKTSTLTIDVPGSTALGRSTFTVTGTSGLLSHSTQADIDVQNSSLPLPTATLTADPVTINEGDSSNLNWWTTDATQCVIDQGVGVVHSSAFPADANGTEVVSPLVSTTYTLTCSNSNGSASDTATVNVNSGPPGDGGDLSCSVDRSPANGDAPLDVTFTINASGGSAPYQYRLDPKDGSGFTGFGNNNVIVHTYNDSGIYSAEAEVRDRSNNTTTCFAPIVNVSSSNVCDISADPSAILSGQSTTISWGCSNPPDGYSCSIDNGIGPVDPNGGSEKVRLTETTTFTLTCDGEVQDSVTVRVGFIPLLREILPRF